MQPLNSILKYIREFFSKEFNWPYALLVILLLGVIIYFNYWHGLEKKYAAGSSTWVNGFAGYYLLYLIPFAFAFFLQPLFFKDCSYYNSKWFWIILFTAPAFFSFRVNFNFHKQWIIDTWPGEERVFYQYCINWLVRVFVLLIPVAVIWFVKDKAAQPFYGTKPLNAVQPYLIMLLIMVPLIALAAAQKDFQQVYPKAKVLAQIQASKWRYVFFELCYSFDFVSIEFFFRGFLILSLMNICGMHCIIPMACFYCCIHLGKPMGEAISSFFGGALLGIIAYNTGSIWGGLLVHLGIAWLMETGGWLTAAFYKH